MQLGWGLSVAGGGRTAHLRPSAQVCIQSSEYCLRKLGNYMVLEGRDRKLDWMFCSDESWIIIKTEVVFIVH